MLPPAGLFRCSYNTSTFELAQGLTTEFTVKRLKNTSVMTRGDPVCRREDCSPFDIGLVFDEIHNYSPHQKLEFVENVWKPGELFDFPVSMENGKSRKFVSGWLKRFPWLAYSKYFDGAFRLACVCFGVQCGRNANKLDKL